MPQTAPPEIIEQFREGFEWWNCGEIDLMQTATQRTPSSTSPPSSPT
jgi:hypothetical protein